MVKKKKSVNKKGSKNNFNRNVLVGVVVLVVLFTFAYYAGGYERVDNTKGLNQLRGVDGGELGSSCIKDSKDFGCNVGICIKGICQLKIGGGLVEVIPEEDPGEDPDVAVDTGYCGDDKLYLQDDGSLCSGYQFSDDGKVIYRYKCCMQPDGNSCKYYNDNDNRKKFCEFYDGTPCSYRNTNLNPLYACVYDDFTTCYFNPTGTEWSYCEEESSCNGDTTTTRCDYKGSPVKKDSCKLIDSQNNEIFSCLDSSIPLNGLDEECADAYAENCDEGSSPDGDIEGGGSNLVYECIDSIGCLPSEQCIDRFCRPVA